MITSATSDTGVIMGVRHRTYVVEAVQYHPESILSEEGEGLLRNFLALRGGTWEENPHARVTDPEVPPFPFEALIAKSKSISTDAAKSSAPSILTKIAQKRTSDVESLSNTPGLTLSALNAHLSLHLAPPSISLSQRLLQARNGMALLAEIKRASPSAGPIAPHTSAPHTALSYALAGASAISVLTEPTYFHGHLEDMRAVRLTLEGLDRRPAVLRKDFVLSEYQVVEARLAGADSVLLIVAMLGEDRTRELLEYSMSLGMEPLVEVNCPSELHVALDVGAKVIGVNNRNLHSFTVDMSTTSSVAEVLEQKGKTGEVILCALSGIKGPADVRAYREQAVKAVLVGESLMRAEDKGKFVRQLLDLDDPVATLSPENPKTIFPTPLVKICGILSASEALNAANAGADFLGLVFVPTSKRRVGVVLAREISLAVRNAFPLSESDDEDDKDENLNLPLPWFTSHTRASYLPSPTRKTRPLLVGVFQNQPLRYIQRIVHNVGLDMVQLHGSEPIEWSRSIGVPVIRVGGVPPPSPATSASEEKEEIVDGEDKAEGVQIAPLPTADPLTTLTTPGYHHFILLDTTASAQSSSPSGGTGKILDWALATRVVNKGEVPVISPDVSVGSLPARRVVNGTGEQNGHEQSISAFPLPLILAGGLSPSNVREAVEIVRPWAVDVSGGVERDGIDSELEKQDGRKDAKKVLAFVRAAKGIS
jgi:anthranilate synthase/indole-3-glycerol phosphate synthase/phosphoribosylanthranilate isomerase